VNIEEDYFNDLLLFIKLLNTLNKIDTDQQQFESERSKQKQLDSIDIIITGLEFIIPLMNQELLKFQPLCVQYYKLISETAFKNGERLFSRSFQLFSTLISSIEYGVNAGAGTEIKSLSLECTIPLCNQIFLKQAQSTDHATCLRNLFKVC
jgi:hypothetical protein